MILSVVRYCVAVSAYERDAFFFILWFLTSKRLVPTFAILESKPYDMFLFLVLCFKKKIEL